MKFEVRDQVPVHIGIAKEQVTLLGRQPVFGDLGACPRGRNAGPISLLSLSMGIFTSFRP